MTNVETIGRPSVRFIQLQIHFQQGYELMNTESCVKLDTFLFFDTVCHSNEFNELLRVALSVQHVEQLETTAFC